MNSDPTCQPAALTAHTHTCIHMQYGACIDHRMVNQETAVAAKPRLCRVVLLTTA